ncbi:MAG: T9SS type A sorting domain-containing protein [Bacteroidales bacterium]|nr:T9SS type A sorting domain-containing protein [Bacteroidales bacterium]
MKAIYVLILTFFYGYSLVLSQGCLPEGITFSTQSQIDNFQSNYPGCIEIEGYFTIEGSDITNLTGLNMLTAVGGILTIKDTENLENLEGLNSLEYTGLDFHIMNNHGLFHLTGLENLQVIGGNLNIYENESMLSLAGLETLSEIFDNLWIIGNTNLVNLAGLDGLTAIGQTISIASNSSLTSILALSSLVAIGDAIYIDNNDNLSSLAGLDNIDPNSILNLLIINNDLLSTCDVESICDYLTNPNGIIEIYGNANGCDSQEEVKEACDEITVEEVIFPNNISIFPNPADDILTIKSVPANRIEEVKLYNQIGEKVLHVYPLNNVIDISTLSQGMYIVEVEFTNSIIREKLIIK